MTALALLSRWVARQASAEARAWFAAALAQMPAASEPARLMVLALAPRRLGRASLELSADDLAEAELARRGWRPGGLTMPQAARIALLAATYDGDGPAFTRRLTSLCRAGDLQENVGYCRGLPVLPAGPLLIPVAREGVRSAVQPIFEAVALNSPIPAELFDEAGWNQMVLKAIFIGSSVADIQGLDRRANKTLATTLVDYAHERWSAGRSIDPALWRCVTPFAGDYERAALRRAGYANAELP